MDKNYLIQLTNNLYKLTLLFPKKEPLRYKIREIADTILATLIHNQAENVSRPIENLGSSQKYGNPISIISELETLDSYFEVAKAQNWVPVVELLRLQEEYNRIKAEIKKIPKKPLTEGRREGETVDVRQRQQRQTLPTPGVGINTRQGKILDFLRENGGVQIWQLKQVFPEVTKRTLRRDFEFLLKQGKIERMGERNETFYQLRSLAP